jgi:hypothetical protein
MIVDSNTYELSDLVYASRRGDLEAVKRLSAHVDVNECDEDGYGALYAACLKKQYHVVEYLCSCGADPNARVKDTGLTPLLLAKSMKDFSLIRVLSAASNRMRRHQPTSSMEIGQPPRVCEEEDECSICMSSARLLELSCGHRFCRECLSGWFASQISSQRFLCACPARGCGRLASFHEIAASLTDEAVRARFESLVLQCAVSSEPDFRWCQRCSSGGFLSSSDCSEVECVDCGHRFCAVCLAAGAHPGLTCEQRCEVDEDLADLKNERWKLKNSKPCPKCSCLIQRNGGCSHMTCTRCKYEFCWLCLGPYQPGKYTFGNKCPCVKK